MHREANCNALQRRQLVSAFFLFSKLGGTRTLNTTAFNCTHKTGRSSRFRLTDALFTVIITTTVFVSHFCISFYLITVRSSVDERYVVH